MIQDLEKKLVLQRSFRELFISNTINLAAHYKKFFVSKGYNTKVYLYYTDLNSDNFYERKYNEEFRTYYLNKFNGNYINKML